MSDDLLVIHCRDDLEVPVADGRAISQVWPGASLVETNGLGHRRILRDGDSVSRAAAFLTGDHAADVSSDAIAVAAPAELIESPA